MHRYEPQGFEYLKFQQKISEAEAQANDETHVQAANATATMQIVAAITPASEADSQVVVQVQPTLPRVQAQVVVAQVCRALSNAHVQPAVACLGAASTYLGNGTPDLPR